MVRRDELVERITDYAQKYGFRKEQQAVGFENYVVHLFAQEDGLDWVLDGQPTRDADLSEYILHGDDLGVDGVLIDPAAKRVVLTQCTMQTVDKLEGKLTSFSGIVDRLVNPRFLEKGGEQAQQLLSPLSEQLNDGYSVELRLACSRAVGGIDRLAAIVEAE